MENERQDPSILILHPLIVDAGWSQQVCVSAVCLAVQLYSFCLYSLSLDKVASIEYVCGRELFFHLIELVCANSVEISAVQLLL